MKRKFMENYIDKWKEKLNAEVKKSSAIIYISVYENTIYPYFKNIALNSIEEKCCNQFINYLYKELAFTEAYIDLITVTLKKILSFFYDLGYMNKKIRIVSKGKKLRNNDFKMLTDPECAKLIEYLKNNPNNKNLGIILGIYTGLRIGEICALKFENLDLSENLIEIKSTLQRLNGQLYITEPKTRNSIRTLPIPNKLLEFINKVNYADKRFYILTNKEKPFEPRSFRRYFKKILAINELPDVKFHSLRHAFATKCVELNFDHKTVSEFLGHSSVNITLNLYVHPTLNTKRKYMEKLTGNL